MIPLKLQPVEGNSTSSNSPTTPIPASTTLSPQKKRPKPIRPIWDRLIFPYTLEDWRIIMDEVKKLYLGRQYKQCTARCINILDSITDPYRVHPLYSLFLSFYCATCLEITASNLHNNSPQKLSLLRDSLLYFQKTEEYLTYADIPMESDAPISGNRSSSMSSTSSARSSVDSVFSSTSFPSTADGLSPAFSSCSFEDGNDEKTPTRIRTLSVSSVASTQSTQSTDTTIIADRPAPLRIKKKVSFSPALPTLISAQDLENSSSMETIPRSIQSQNTLPRPIIYHIIHINSLIDTIQSVRKSRRSNQASLSPSLFNSTGDLSKEDKEEMRRKEIRERIEKLRSAGWERKRWNGSRSEALREKVDNELNGWI